MKQVAEYLLEAKLDKDDQKVLMFFLDLQNTKLQENYKGYLSLDYIAEAINVDTIKIVKALKKIMASPFCGGFWRTPTKNLMEDLINDGIGKLSFI